MTPQARPAPPGGETAPAEFRFMGLGFPVMPDVLAPRAETELLGRAALEALAARGRARLLVVDMCCGAGNLAVAIAARVVGARAFACDLTDGAVAAARASVARHGLGDRVSVLQGDLFAPLADHDLEGRVDLVVCNPPYISTGRLAKDRAHLLADEPREAFDGGPYGIAILQRIAREAGRFLAPGGVLACEFGEGQGRQVERLLARTGTWADIAFLADTSGTARVVTARRAASSDIAA